MDSHHEHFLLQISTLLLISPAISRPIPTLHNIDGRSALCVPKECPPGTQAVLCRPGSGNIRCEPCPPDLYQDKITYSENGSRCRQKRVCNPNSGMEEVEEENGADLTRINQVCRCMTEDGYQDANYRRNKSAEECLYCADQKTVISGRCVRCSGIILVNEDGHKRCAPGTQSTPAPSSVTDNKVTPPTDAMKKIVTTGHGAVQDKSEAHITNGISSGWIVGITCGCIIVVVLIGIGGYCCKKKKLGSNDTSPCSDGETNSTSLLGNGQTVGENSASISLWSDQFQHQSQHDQTSGDEGSAFNINHHTQNQNHNGSGVQVNINGSNKAPVTVNIGTSTTAAPETVATEALNREDGTPESQSPDTEYSVRERSCTGRAVQEIQERQDSHRLDIEGLEGQ